MQRYDKRSGLQNLFYHTPKMLLKSIIFKKKWQNCFYLKKEYYL